MNDFLKILNDLEMEIRDSRKSMLGGNRYIDEGKCMDYILTLKSLLPQEMKEAQIILSERDNILNEAEATAEKIVSEAQAKADKMLDESEIIARAEYEAEQIQTNARQYWSRIEYETVNTVLGLLTNAENKLVDILGNIRDSKEDLMSQNQQHYRRN